MMRRLLVAAALLDAAVTSTACHATRHPATTTPATIVTPHPSVACAGSGVRVVSSSPVEVRHDQVSAVARLGLAPGVAPADVTAAEVVDPVATKVGLPSGPRTMWLVLVREPAPSPSGPAVVFPGAGGPQLTLRLVDDATLVPAGAFACQPSP
jgi:hypothetical protein